MIAVVENGNAEVVVVCDNRFKQNCFLLTKPGLQSCIVVDPGYGYATIALELRQRSLSIDCIIATHAHFDHIASVALLQRDFDEPPFLCHPAEDGLLAQAGFFASMLSLDPIAAPVERRPMVDGEVRDFDGDVLRAHHTPGHTPGSIILEYRDLLFSGDLLLRAPAVVRRLPGTNPEQLELSRGKVLSSFRDETRVFPGHGRPTTIGELRQAHARREL